MSPGAPRQPDGLLPKFGLQTFRPGQREVIDAVLAGDDCLCVMPTGGGKSLCYQLPALALPGLTLVVSPLISLMQDQVAQLQRLGLRATFVNSSLSPAEQRSRLREMAEGAFDLVYVAAERFRSPRFLEAVTVAGVRLLAIDEAHCISQWGHDFRPDYAKLGRARKRLGNPTTIALTATATPAVREDIAAQLELRDPKTFVTGFERPNLFYEVRVAHRDRRKDEALLELFGQQPGSGIVYAATRKRCEEVAATLAAETDRRVAVYHAGLDGDVRRQAQEEFMSGRTDVVVATNAFGMGINKADVRFVVHYNLPKSLEAYYQEAGRAGRDGEPSRCLLLFSQSDLSIQEYFIESAYPTPDVVGQVYEYLRSIDADPIELTQQEIKERLDLSVSADAVRTSEQVLERAGALERLEAGQNMAIVRIDSDSPTLVDYLPKQATVRRKILRAVEGLVGEMRFESVHFYLRDLATLTGMDQPAVSRGLRELCELKDFDYVPPFRGRAIHLLQRDTPFEKLELDFETMERRKAEEYAKLDRVIHFARGARCRQQTILDYFGQSPNPPCGHCDHCDPGAAMGPADSAAVGSDHPAVIEAVRMALAGVARTHGQFGKNVVAMMLCGSTSGRLSKTRLDKLSTYGLLKDLRQTEVADLIDSLMAAGYVEQFETQPHRPLVRLTAEGGRVMREETPPSRLVLAEELALRLKSRGGEEGSASDVVEESRGPLDADVLARLKEWRRGVAEERRLPPHYVLPNSALENLASRLPSSPAGLLEIKGIGETTVQRYGRDLLSIVGAMEGKTPRQEPATATVTERDQRMETGEDEAPETSEPVRETAASPPIAETPARDAAIEAPPEQRPSHYWTWRLLEAGFTPAECVAIRSLSPEAIFDHALRAAEEGLALDPKLFLSPDLLAALESLIGDSTPKRIRPLLAELPPGTRYAEVQLYLRCRR